MKRIISLTIICLLTSLFIACGKNETIEGKWTVVKETFEDGTEICGDDIKVSETYDISEGIAKYTCCLSESGADKDVTLTLVVSDKGNNIYNFMFSENFTFVTAEIQGKYLVYTVGDETFYFEKTK